MAIVSSWRSVQVCKQAWETDRIWGLAIGVAMILAEMSLAQLAQAQVTPDTTLGGESSIVTPNATVRGLPAELIRGGATRGANLFHSFLRFNVNDGQRVYFNNPIGVNNIFSRVTGADPSKILGTLGVNGAANLFLLNPNGILFGPNARLDITGSFLGSTARSLVFENGLTFSATNPEAPPLLAVNLRPGLQYGGTAAGITNAGNLTVGQDLTLAGGHLDLQGQLQAGGDITLRALDTARIRDSATHPFIAAAAGKLLVQGDRSIDIFALNHPNSGFFSGGDMILRSASTVGGDAHYTAYGNFQIEKLDGSLGSLYSPHDPVIRAAGDVVFDSYQGASLHIFAGGRVIIPSYVWIQSPDPVNGIQETVQLANGSTVQIDGRVQPTLDVRAGTLAFDAPGATGNVTGVSPIPGVPVLAPGAPTRADIQIGTILFVAPGFNFVTGDGTPQTGTVFLTNQYQPNPTLSGTIRVEKTQGVAFLNGRAIVSGGFAGGGTIDIHSKGDIEVDGIINADPANFVGVIAGNGGDVTLRAAGDITLASGSIINSTGVLGGKIVLDSDGTLAARDGGIFSFSIGTVPGQKAEDIEVTARSLFLNSATIGTSVIPLAVLIPGSPQQTAAANAGNIILRVSDTIRMTNASQIRGLVEAGGSGRAADIDIQAGSLVALDGSQIGSALFRERRDPSGAIIYPGAQGSGGNIRVIADSILLSGYNPNGGFSSGLIALTEEGALGPAGNVFVQADFFRLQNGAGVAAGTRNPGDGGNITIQTNIFEVLSGAKVLANSDSTGRGGTIDISATERITIQGLDTDYTDRLDVIDQYIESSEGEGTDRLDILGGVDISYSGLFANTQGLGEAGNIRLAAPVIDISDTGVVLASTSGAAKGGDIFMRSQALSLRNGGEVLAQTFATGAGGSITLEPLNPALFSSVTLTGVADFPILDDGITIGGFSSGLIVNTEDEASGSGGSINVNATTLRILDGAVLSARTRGTGRGGDITVNVDTLELFNGGQILAPTFGSGRAGIITINATGDSTISGADFSLGDRSNAVRQAYQTRFNLTEEEARQRARFTIDPVSSASGLQVTVEPEAVALLDNLDIGGSIRIQGRSLRMDGGSEIGAGTSGFGNAGNVSIQLSNALRLEDISTIRAVVEPGGIGKGGNINVAARSVNLLSGSQILATVLRPLNGRSGGSGAAGNVQINAADFVNIAGSGTDGRGTVFSGVLASTEQGALGPAGDVEINAGFLRIANRGFVTARTGNSSDAGNVRFRVRNDLILQNGGAVTVNGEGTGNPGNLAIEAGSIQLSGGSRLQAITNSGRNANINLSVRGGVFMFPRDNEISAEAYNNGDGGNITIRATAIISALRDNNDIVANAFTGAGGNIDATGVPISPRRFRQFERTVGRTFDSDFVASSELGIAGTVEIDTQERIQESLPTALVDRSGQISQACRSGVGGGSEFTVTGRGGMPANPFAPLNAGSVLVDWIALNPAENQPVSKKTEPLTSNPQSSTAIVEAQGWTVDGQGNVVLVAQASNLEPQPVPASLASCLSVQKGG